MHGYEKNWQENKVGIVLLSSDSCWKDIHWKKQFNTGTNVDKEESPTEKKKKMLQWVIPGGFIIRTSPSDMLSVISHVLFPAVLSEIKVLQGYILEVS